MFEKKDNVVVVSCVYNCPKSTKCPKWVELTTTHTLEDGTKKEEIVGRCAEAWIAYLLVELKESLNGKDHTAN